MSTLPPPSTEPSGEDSLESKAYGIVEKLGQYIPVANDRNRLGFNLYRYLKGEGDDPSIIVNNAKLKIEGITPAELADKIKAELEKINLFNFLRFGRI